MKYRSEYFLQFPRTVFKDPHFNSMSINAKWLFACLLELEHRYTGGKNKQDFFFQSNKELAVLMGASERTVQKAKGELKKAELIKTWQMHWRDPETRRLSEKHVSAYRLGL